MDYDRKVKSTDIVNGLARIDIHDSQGVLLVKKGSRIREVHYQRMRDEGLIVEEEQDSKRADNQLNINYSPPDSIHSRLGKLILIFLEFQKQIISNPQPELKEDLNYVCESLAKLCEQNIYQVLGELYLSDYLYYSYVKPLYIAASLKELIKRLNQVQPDQLVTDEKIRHLMQAALLHSLGLLNSRHQNYSHNRKLNSAQRSEILLLYPRASLLMAEKIGVTATDTLDAIKHHNIETLDSSLESQLLRTPFVFAGIAMHRHSQQTADIINPTREFTRMFAEQKLDPVLGGLFLKINGIMPVGSILQFDSYEKAVVISGPDESNIASSMLRMITGKSGVQLDLPGEKFRLDQTKLVHKGIADHHQFAWDKFAPFVAWEK